MKLYHAYPKLVNIVGTSHNGKINFMAVAWHTYLSFDPPLYGISIAPKRYTHKLLKECQEFNCNFLSYHNIKLSHGVGRTSGSEFDKVKAFGIPLKPGEKINTPYIKDSYAVMECKVTKEIHTGDHVLIVGSIENIISSKEYFTEKELLNPQTVIPILYLGSNTYLKIEKCKIEEYPQKINIDEWLR